MLWDSNIYSITKLFLYEPIYFNWSYNILKLFRTAKEPHDYVLIIKLLSDDNSSTDELFDKLINFFKNENINEEDTRLISQIINNKYLFNLMPEEEYSILTIWLSLLYVIDINN